MIEVTCPGGQVVRLREMQRYDPSLDSNSIRLSVWYDGSEYFGVAPIEPGKSLREAREKLHKALEMAVHAGKPGKVTI